MGVKAVDDKTLEVTLTTPQPWFVQQVAHSLVPGRAQGDGGEVRREVDRGGEHRHQRPVQARARGSTTPTSTSSRDDEWRDAASVKLTRVNGRMIYDGIDRRAGVRGRRGGRPRLRLPPDEIARLKDTPESYEQYPGLGTYYYGFNVENITDVKQRRAMSLAIDRARRSSTTSRRRTSCPRPASRRRGCPDSM